MFTYIAGVTGAIMPCSTLGEVTATITGSAINSLVYVKFDFLETVLIPGMVLNEESIFRTFIVHAIVPFLTLGIGFLHMILLHKNKYSGAGGFKRLPGIMRLRATRRWYYSSRY
jgi:quinol-cytochrome oxidoreductase complex cytochrome b subunit